MTNRVNGSLALLPALLLSLLLSPHATAPGQAMSLIHQQQPRQYQQFQHHQLQQLSDDELVDLDAAKALASNSDYRTVYNVNDEPSSSAAARQAGSIINDWMTNDKRILPQLSEDRLIILDNVLTAVLRNARKKNRRSTNESKIQRQRPLVQKHLRKRRQHLAEQTQLRRNSDDDDYDNDYYNYPSIVRKNEDRESKKIMYAKEPLRPGKRKEPTESVRPSGDKRNYHRHHQQEEQQPSNNLIDRQDESISQSLDPVAAAAATTTGIASQFLTRSARGNRQYDVPQIGE